MTQRKTDGMSSMSGKPLISIIITVYNYEQYVAECLMSCVEQDYPNLEIIVVDDCSTDRSYEVAQKFHRHIKLLKSDKNRGYSHCKNIGIRKAKGEFIVFIDADDVLIPDSIERRYQEFEKDSRIDFVHAQAWRWRYKKGKWQKDGYRKKAKIHAQTVMMRRKVFKEYGLFYEKLRSKADKEMWYRLGIHEDSPFPKLIKPKKVKIFVALYRKHDLQMHKVRKKNKAVNLKINEIFKNRIKQLKREGVTKGNTLWI